MKEITMMERTETNGCTLYFDREEREAAEIIEKACRKSIETITNTWGLNSPQDCCIYVLNSWPRCVFLGAPLSYQIILAITIPLWYSEFKQRWKYAGGWAQRYGDRQVVGIKTPYLIENTPESIGEDIFLKNDSTEEKVTAISCHELTHAFTSHLSLPAWFHEGLAMVTVDQCLKKTTVKRETLEILKDTLDEVKPSEKIDLRSQNKEDIIKLYVRGYWLTRFLLESQPDLIKSLLGEAYSNQELESKISAIFGTDPERFWKEIEGRVLDYFEQYETDKSV